MGQSAPNITLSNICDRTNLPKRRPSAAAFGTFSNFSGPFICPGRKY